jgi:hypothetical protein
LGYGQSIRSRCLLFGLTIFILVFLCTVTVMASEWLVLNTEHFRVYFREPLKDQAEQVAQRAEEAFGFLADSMGHEPDGVIHVILEDRIEQVNAYASPLFFNHIVIYTGFPTPYESLFTGFPGEYKDWWEILVTHELAHIFQLDVKPEEIEKLISLFGRVPYLSSPLITLPPLVLEGTAVLQESLLPGGRGEGSYYDMFLRTAVIEGNLLELDQAVGNYSFENWQPAGAAYLYGYSFLKYLSQEYPQFDLNTFSRQLASKPGKFSKYLSEVTGLDIAQLWWKWQMFTANEHLVKVDQIRKEALTQTTVFPIHSLASLYPTPFRGSGKFAYICLDGPYPALHLFDPETGEDVRITSLDSSPFGLSWDSTGEVIYAGMLVTTGLNRVSPRLIKIDLSTNKTQVFQEIEGFAPTVSPDGSRLAYISRDKGESKLMLLDISSEQSHTLFSYDNTEFTGLAWAPESDRLAVSFWSSSYGSGIGVYDITEDKFSVLAGAVGTFQFPAWSTDEEYILFDADLDGVFNLYAYHLGSKEMLRLTNTLTGLFHPRALENNLLVALEYTSEGYKAVSLPFEPEKGKHIYSSVSFPSKNPTPQVTGSIQKYSPWPSILPQFWLPMVQYSGDVTYLGAYTWGQDILSQNKYSAQVYMGLKNWQLGYSLQYEQNVDAAGNYHWYTSIQRKPSYQSDTDFRIKDLHTWSVGVAWRGPHHLLQIEGVRQAVKTDPGSTEVNYAGLISFKTANRYQSGQQDHLGHLTIQLEVPWPLDNGWQLIYTQQARILREKGQGPLLVGSFAYSPGRKTSLGGEMGLFSLRGYPYEYAKGTTVGQFTIEPSYRLFLIERGFLDKPLMLKDISICPFIDMGFAKTQDHMAGGVSIGAELSVNFILGYGNSDVDWRFGLAWGLNQNTPRMYMRIASGL